MKVFVGGGCVPLGVLVQLMDWWCDRQYSLLYCVVVMMVVVGGCFFGPRPVCACLCDAGNKTKASSCCC